MLIDLSLQITPKMMEKIGNEHRYAAFGHLGTHIDIMDKEFPMAYIQRKAVIFDVSSIKNRDIGLEDIDLQQIGRGMFVAFCSGHLERCGYGSDEYHHDHPQLSYELIEALIGKEIALIGIDFPGIRRGKEHTAADRHCADHDIFIIENLCDLHRLGKEAVINTYPLNLSGFSGLPCRVVAVI